MCRNHTRLTAPHNPRYMVEVLQNFSEDGYESKVNGKSVNKIVKAARFKQKTTTTKASEMNDADDMKENPKAIRNSERFEILNKEFSKNENRGSFSCIHRTPELKKGNVSLIPTGRREKGHHS